MTRLAVEVRRPREIVLEDLRNCITSVVNVAQLLRMRSTGGDVAERELLDEEIARLHRLGTETRELSRDP